jgi:hypothetical protein
MTFLTNLSKKVRRLTLAFAFFTVILLLVLHFKATKPSQKYEYMLSAFWFLDVDQKLERAGFVGASVSRCEPTADGQGLLFSGCMRGETGSACWVVKNGIIRCVRSPGNITYADDQGRLVAWENATNVHFASGANLDLPPGRFYFSTDVSGKYFTVNVPNNITRLGRIGKECDVAWYTANFSGGEPHCIGNKIFLFGSDPAADATCWILVDDGSKILTAERIDLHFYGGVILDVDPSGQILLVRKGDPEFSSFYFYELQSGKSTRCYPSAGNAIVLCTGDPFTK